jgi:hypothetical protein
VGAGAYIVKSISESQVRGRLPELLLKCRYDGKANRTQVEFPASASNEHGEFSFHFYLVQVAYMVATMSGVASCILQRRIQEGAQVSGFWVNFNGQSYGSYWGKKIALRFHHLRYYDHRF